MNKMYIAILRKEITVKMAARGPVRLNFEGQNKYISTVRKEVAQKAWSHWYKSENPYPNAKQPFVYNLIKHLRTWNPDEKEMVFEIDRAGHHRINESEKEMTTRQKKYNIAVKVEKSKDVPQFDAQMM